MLIRLLRTYLRPYRGLLVVLLGLQAVQALLNLYLPNINGEIIDRGVLRGDSGYIWRMGGVMLGVTAVQAVFAVTAIYLGSRVAMAFGRDVRGVLFHRSVALSAREVNQIGASSLITRVTNDVQQVQMLVVMVCTFVLAAPVTIVGGVIMALRQDAGLSWLLGLSMPALAIALGIIIGRMLPQFRLMQARLDGVNRVLREQITGIRVVRAFVREPQEVKRFGVVNDELTQTSLIAGRLMSLMFPVVMLVINASNSAVVWFGANRIAHGQMTIGSLIAFLTYFTLILIAVMMATFVGVLAPRAAVSGERIQEVLDTEPSVTPPENPVRELRTPGTLEFRDVSFGYPGAAAPVLCGVSFRALPGKTTAVIGSTGAGKTTLVNLACRMIDPTVGAVAVGGVDVRELDPDVLWHRIGLVPQRPYLFTGTVATNLRYGKPDATDDDLWEALAVAQADNFVRTMGGLDAPITQGGSNVSGGQRQRLSIARALVRKPDVYVFDDSFSALDLATDARLRAALAPYTVESTVVIVAQRVSSIVNADQILVLEAGVPVGLGTHSELLERCPTYAEIVASQTAAEDAA
ncbi:MAG: ATP-binding cassette, subfamily multidrug efflux pump [Acidimicrobiaceae bacterium]|nr:ATP-binding cassette, subfamily multidrug efflux pump [Acidimicrobiaceae bacterium]